MPFVLSRSFSGRQTHTADRRSQTRSLLSLAALSALLSVSLLYAPFAHAGGISQTPGGIDKIDIAVDADPGASYPWEGSSGDTNTGNGNKMTTLPITGWTARGGLPVSLSLFHNSQGSGASELGAKWSHSYDIYLVTDPEMGTASVRWGDALGYPFAFNSSAGTYSAPAGIQDHLVATWDASGNPTSFALTTKGGTKYTFSGGAGTRWNCVSITDRNNNTLTISHNSADFVTAVTDPSGRALIFTYDGSNHLTEVSDPLGRSFLFSYNTGGDLSQIIYPSAVPASGLNPTATLAYNTNHCITTLTDARSQNWTFTYASNGSVLTERNPLLI